MDGLLFSVSFAAVTVSAAEDLISLVTSSRTRIELCAIRLGQVTKASEEAIGIQLIRGYTTAPSGGGAAVPAPHRPWSRAAVTTARINDTTLAADGTAVVLLADAWHLLRGWRYKPGHPHGGNDADQERLFIEKSTRVVLRCTAPAAGYSMSGTLVFRELGMIAP